MAHTALWPLVVHMFVTPPSPSEPAPIITIVEKVALPALEKVLKPAEVFQWPVQIRQRARRRH